jgi:putative ABC transport system permease protein
VATALPVRRAVRVAPVEAIQTAHRAVSGGLAPLVRRLPLPGSTVAMLPVRNVVRGPRRTILTALGIGAAIAVLVGVIGMIDSFVATIDLGEEEFVGEHPEQLTVGVDFAPVDSEAVRAVTGSPLVADAETGLALGGTLEPGEDEIDVLLAVTDFDSDLWRPTASSGELNTDRPGIVLAQKAADDLGVAVGDTVVLRHPRRQGLVDYQLVDSELPVLAIHPNPYRFLAYVDSSHAGLFDLEGITNTVRVSPAPGVTTEEVQRGLFPEPGVVSVEPVTAAGDAVREQIEEFVSIFAVIELAVLLLALLIAFNSTAINMDERARENATMFAYGLPAGRVLLVSVVESLMIGVLGTIVGVVAGRLLLEWLLRVLLPSTFPDIGMVIALSASTLVTAVLFGVVAVAVAPILTLRRLRRMDIPSTLRVME